MHVLLSKLYEGPYEGTMMHHGGTIGSFMLTWRNSMRPPWCTMVPPWDNPHKSAQLHGCPHGCHHGFSMCTMGDNMKSSIVGALVHHRVNLNLQKQSKIKKSQDFDQILIKFRSKIVKFDQKLWNLIKICVFQCKLICKFWSNSKSLRTQFIFISHSNLYTTNTKLTP